MKVTWRIKGRGDSHSPAVDQPAMYNRLGQRWCQIDGLPTPCFVSVILVTAVRLPPTLDYHHFAATFFPQMISYNRTTVSNCLVNWHVTTSAGLGCSTRTDSIFPPSERFDRTSDTTHRSARSSAHSSARSSAHSSPATSSHSLAATPADSFTLRKTLRHGTPTAILTVGLQEARILAEARRRKADTDGRRSVDCLRKHERNDRFTPA